MFNITGIDVKPERHFSLAARNYSLSDLSIGIVRWRVQEKGLSLWEDNLKKKQNLVHSKNCAVYYNYSKTSLARVYYLF